MNNQHYSQCKFDVTNSEKKSLFGDSFFQKSPLQMLTEDEMDHKLWYSQNQSLEMEWSIQEPLEPHSEQCIQEYAENYDEQGFIVEFASSYHSLSEFFEKNISQQPKVKSEPKNPSQKQTKSKKQKTTEKRKKGDSRPCCNCKQSQCLKRYCPCFHIDSFCTNCTCKGCQNNSEHIAEVEKARMHVFRNCHRKKQQPREKLLQNNLSYGCSCSKTKCQQAYCECFKRGQVCNEHCKCLDCKNISQPQKENLNILNPGSTISYSDLTQAEEQLT